MPHVAGHGRSRSRGKGPSRSQQRISKPKPLVSKPSNRQPGLNISNNRPSKIIPKIKLKPPRDSQNNNDDKKIKPIIPKPKPKPDEKKKEIRLDIPGSDPDKDDRPKTGVTTEVKKEEPKMYALQYNVDLSSPSKIKPTSLMVDNNQTKKILGDNNFQSKVENFILGYIPEQLHSTVGASYILAKAAIEQGYTYDVNKAIDITLGWKDNFNIAIKGEF